MPEPKYALVVRSLDNGAEETEVPTDQDDNLGLETLVAAFPGANGLKYKNPKTGRLQSLLKVGGKFYAPSDDGWSNKVFVVIPEDQHKTDTKQDELNALEQSPKYTKWVDKIRPRVLYTTWGSGRKQCVTPLNNKFALTYQHKSHQALRIGRDSLEIRAEFDENFGTLNALVVDYDKKLDVVLLKADDGEYFTKEEFARDDPREGTHYLMIGFSNPDQDDSHRISLGYVATVEYKTKLDECRFNGSSGALEGDSGAGCWDRCGRLLGINVSVASKEIDTIKNEEKEFLGTQLCGGLNNITPIQSIVAKFQHKLIE